VLRKYLFLICLLFPISAFAGVETPPEGFVIQILEPTGGKILKPVDWYYTESHRGPSYTWILSKEEAKTAPYETGVRVQTFINVKKGTGKSPKEFMLEFFEQKKKSVQRIHKTCQPCDQGLFTRICLEVNEGPYRILYSLFWGNKTDIAAVSIAGTKIELWDKYKSTFDMMSGFELIDMKRFESK